MTYLVILRLGLKGSDGSEPSNSIVPVSGTRAGTIAVISLLMSRVVTKLPVDKAAG